MQTFEQWFLRVTSLEPCSVCLEIIGGIVLTGVTWSSNCLSLELPEDLAQRIWEGWRAGRVCSSLITFPESTGKILLLTRYQVLHCVGHCLVDNNLTCSSYHPLTGYQPLCWPGSSEWPSLTMFCNSLKRKESIWNFVFTFSSRRMWGVFQG